MARTCTICRHDGKEEINRALLDSEPFRHIAARTGTSTTALQRHKNEHLPVALAQAVEAEQVANGDTLLEQLESLRAKASGILTAAEQAGDLRTALNGVKEIRATLELIAKLTGELVNRHQVAVYDATDSFRPYEDWRDDELRAMVLRVGALKDAGLLGSDEALQDLGLMVDGKVVEVI